MAEPPKPSATVVVVRDNRGQLEVLLLERNTGKNIWVFPGGKLDAADGQVDDAQDWEPAGRRAAVREAREEAGLSLDAASLVPISRWITPEVAPKRFDTLFFLSRVDANAAVEVDGGEIASHRWFAPDGALAANHAREIRLAPPTFVTVSWLSAHESTTRALDELGREPLLTFRPRICPVEDGACILYPGDVGYETGDPECSGPRHRLWSRSSGLRYERDAAG